MLLLDRYCYAADKTFMSYSFVSSGPNGLIQKIAQFTRLKGNVYNFGFGDFDQETGDISDTNISNNQDTDVIMGTLGSIIYDFTNVFPGALIIIQGTNAARTRLYQMNIGRYFDAIVPLFDVFGLKHLQWEPFKKGKNYEAFLGRRPHFSNN